VLKVKVVREVVVVRVVAHHLTHLLAVQENQITLKIIRLLEVIRV
jgi:hypothetical protein